MFTLFGTAVGAGILFLPLKAGTGGIWPVLIAALLIGPMTYLAHRGLARVCLTSSNPDGDITDAVTEHFGGAAGSLITLGYFIAIYPIVMVYGIGLTNAVTNVAVNLLGMETPNRLILSGVIVIGLVLIMLTSHKVVVRVTELIVTPLVLILLGVSLYLIPQWEFSRFEFDGDWGGMIKTVLLMIPLLVFAFNHSPAVSTFAGDYRKAEGDVNAEPLASRTLLRTSMMLTVFVMFFVFSCVMALSPDELAQARANNLSTLDAFAGREVEGINWFGWLASAVAMIAITSSFFGHYLGTAEGLHGLIAQRLRGGNPNKAINDKAIRTFVTIFIVVTVWWVANANWSVIGMIEDIVSPILAIILFIMPVVATRTVPAMAKYRSAADIFTLVAGLIAIGGKII
ncbi:MAG: HAAAP family serine/threonine permease, partial [Gammaproteobacteria bacterium]|nr:HAAAP family serine/threonine permease [Gammaproteobacteria bacterium]